MKVLESKLENAVVITCNSTDQVNDLKKDIKKDYILERYNI